MEYESLLTVSNVFKNFGDVIALDGVSLEINSGEIVGLVGSNGAGTVSYTHLTLPTKRIV